MAAHVADTRPAILSVPTLRVLNELCAFRHVVRSIYAFDLVPEKVKALAANLGHAYGLLLQDLTEFNQFLVSINGA